MGELVSISTGSPPGSLCSCTVESLPPSAPRAPHIPCAPPHIPRSSCSSHSSCPSSCFLCPSCSSHPSSHSSSWSSHSPPCHSRSSWKKPLQSLRHKSFAGCHTHHPFMFSLRFATLMRSSSHSF